MEPTISSLCPYLSIINSKTLFSSPPSAFLHSSLGNKFSYVHACLLVAGIWCYAGVFAVGPLSGWGEYGPEPYGTACCINWHAPNYNSAAMSYIICLFFFCYILPCTIIFLSYTFILLTVRGSHQAVQQHMSPQNKITNAQTLIVKVRALFSFQMTYTKYYFLHEFMFALHVICCVVSICSFQWQFASVS